MLAISRDDRKLIFVRKSDFLGCVHLITLYRIYIVYIVTVQGGISHQTSCQRGWCTKLQSSFLHIYFRISEFQASLLLIYFADGPNRCSPCTEIWQKTLSDMLQSTFEIGAAQPRSVTKIAPPQPFLCANRSPQYPV